MSGYSSFNGGGLARGGSNLNRGRDAAQNRGRGGCYRSYIGRPQPPTLEKFDPSTRQWVPVPPQSFSRPFGSPNEEQRREVPARYLAALRGDRPFVRGWGGQGGRGQHSRAGRAIIKIPTKAITEELAAYFSPTNIMALIKELTRPPSDEAAAQAQDLDGSNDAAEAEEDDQH